MELDYLIEESTKIILYFGFNVKIPLWVRYIAVDYDGNMTGFQLEPNRGRVRWSCLGDDIILGKVKLGSTRWTTTLQEFES